VPASAPAQADESKDPRVALLKRLPPGSKLEDLRPSPIAGLYEFAQGTDVSYITVDGKYFIDGNVYDMDTRANLTEALRTHARVALIGAVPESQMVIFSPEKPRYTITVFTDVDCAYCRKLHSEIAELNKLGDRVRYVFYPRTGPGTESWHKAEAVWCSANRNEALTQAKAGATMDLTKTLRAIRRSRANTNWARRSACAARRRSSPRPAISSKATCRRLELLQQLKTADRAALHGAAAGAALAFEQLELVGDAFPALGVGRRILFLADDRPFLGQLRIQLLECLSWPSGISSSEKIASTGHSGSQSVQSMHSSGSITRKFGPSWKQSTGQTSTQSMYLHLMQLSVTTKAMTHPLLVDRLKEYCAIDERSRFQWALELREVMVLAAERAVGEIAPQREFAARERQFLPGNVRFVVQRDLEALRTRGEFGPQHFGPKHHVHLAPHA
jgi:protein-disulfide isomerase